jgi:hypothetical protein
MKMAGRSLASLGRCGELQILLNEIENQMLFPLTVVSMPAIQAVNVAITAISNKILTRPTTKKDFF